ncbi:MAG: trehalose-phosphatase [Thermodesulfobacteriota bacterium]
MRTWAEAGADSAVWRGISAAPQRVLVLDFDGTLSPFVPDPVQARLYPGVRERLEALLDADCCRVVFVTGRECEVLLGLLGLSRQPEVWGSHGGERLFPDGRRESLSPRPEQAAGLDAAERLVRDLGLEACLERKPGCLAFHLRGLEPTRAQAARRQVDAAWSGEAGRSGLELHGFDGGLELRLPGADKGRAVRAILDECEPGAAVFYLGDDLTDEDAFAALGEVGVGVLVRAEPRPSRAAWRIAPPAELLAFLDAFLRACVQAGPSAPASLP